MFFFTNPDTDFITVTFFFFLKERNRLSLLFRMKSLSYKLSLNEVLLSFYNQNYLQREARNGFSNTPELQMTNPGEWGGKGG